MLHHWEQATQNVSQTCRFFGISRGLFHIWRDRYRQDGLVSLRDGLRGARHHPFTTPAHIIALILQVPVATAVRAPPDQPLPAAVPLRLCLSYPIQRILKRHRVPRVSLKSYRPSPRRRRAIHIPGAIGLGRRQAPQARRSSPSTSSRPSMRPPGSVCCKSMLTTPSNRPQRSSKKCAVACRWPSSASRRTMAQSLGPISPGTCGISGSSTGRFREATPRPMERPSAAIGRTRTSSTGA